MECIKLHYTGQILSKKNRHIVANIGLQVGIHSDLGNRTEEINSCVNTGYQCLVIEIS